MTGLKKEESDLLRLSTDYMSRIEKMTERVVHAVNELGRSKEDLEKAKSKYSMANIVLEFLRLLLPVFVLAALVASLRLVPCGFSADYMNASIKAPACEKPEAKAGQK